MLLKDPEWATSKTKPVNLIMHINALKWQKDSYYKWDDNDILRKHAYSFILKGHSLRGV